MTPSTHKLLRTTIAATSFSIGCACLGYGFMYAGYEVGEAVRSRADQDLKIAQTEEVTARHKAIEALYNANKWTLAVEASNRRAEKAERTLEIVCKRVKGRCL